jgi:hypothetical protein
MPASREDISRWFDEAKLDGATHLIVATDTFDYEDYPVHVKKVEDFWEAYKLHNKETNMQRVTEVYDMSLPKDEQMAAPRAWNLPPRETA